MTARLTITKTFPTGETTVYDEITWPGTPEEAAAKHRPRRGVKGARGLAYRDKKTITTPYGDITHDYRWSRA